MPPAEHDIITHDGIEMLVKERDEIYPLYSVHSESGKFFDIFGVNELWMEGDSEDLHDFVAANVLPEHKPQAMAIIGSIMNSIQQRLT